MDTLLCGLLSLAEEYFPLPPDAEYQTCLSLQGRHLAAVQARVGQDFAEKLRDAWNESGQLEREAAFLRGLRLGLALQRL